MAQDRSPADRAAPGLFRRYAYGWLTLAFFIVSFALHWGFGWLAYRDEAAQRGDAAELGGYAVEMARDTFENWQSEFLQLIWQVVGLAYFLYLGSPASKEGDDRIEAKVDALIRLVGDERGEALIARLDALYDRHAGHAKPYGQEQPDDAGLPTGESREHPGQGPGR